MNQENNKTPKQSIRDLLHDFVSENRADVSPYRIYHIKIICLLSYFQLNVANVQ